MHRIYGYYRMGDSKSPIFLVWAIMITNEQIQNLVQEAIEEEYFIVSVSVKKGNVIEVLLDGDNGISIQKCVEVSRHVEGNLDRDIEDFELSVSSAGLGRAFKVHRQYTKNIGREVEVNPKNEKPVKGVLTKVDDDGFEIEVKTKERLENKKKKVEVIHNYRFLFIDEPEVKNIITFK